VEAPAEEKDDELISARSSLSGPKTVGKLDLDDKNRPKKEEDAPNKTEEAPQTPSDPPQAAPEEKSAEAKPPRKAPREEVTQEMAPAEKKSSPSPDQEEKADPAPTQKAGAEDVPKQTEKTEAPKEQTTEQEEPAQPAAKTSEEKPTAATKQQEKAEEERPENTTLDTQYQRLSGPKFTGEKVDLAKFDRPKRKKKVASSTDDKSDLKKKRKRKRISPHKGGDKRKGGGRGAKPELTEEEVQKQVKETLEKLTGGGKKNKGAKLRREKRQTRREKDELEALEQEEQSKVIQVTEFVTVSELANMMDAQVTQVISSCMSLGMMVTMNQRLDGETLQIVAEEFGYEVEFVSADVTEAIEEEQEDDPGELEPRAPIVTVMGHVDHGKTSLLDYIRKANVIAGESGGITQHIGAYAVKLEDAQQITFLDTPGHEAFTAMRARGAQVTDIAIVVIAADDDVMPQTKEAISHAQAAGVPMIFAINKIDKPGANPEKVKQTLAGMNLLVEDFGGKVQSQDVSAKKGKHIDELLEKVLLEAELLELKANPNRNATGTVVEAALDKGRGYVSTILVQNGTLHIGDYVLAGQFSGKVRAMLDERGQKIDGAGPARPVTILGLDGAPQAGDTFVVMEDEREAKNIAAKRTQLQREQSARSQKNLTLEEIGRRLAIGDFQELNVIVKGDVDGSIEALSDALQKLSTDEIQVNIIHKGVGQISESDILLAAASDAILVGFQVRPSPNARKIAEKEHVEIRLYSIIYDAINEIRDAMEGMLSPDVKEEITGNIEVRETFKISKVGTIAGCYVLDGKVSRNTKIRVIRDGVVLHTGELASLKRFKDDVKEVSKGYECGLNIKNFNDIKEGDIIEGYQEVEVKKTL
jgi:translation initiation factor IF-2